MRHVGRTAFQLAGAIILDGNIINDNNNTTLGGGGTITDFLNNKSSTIRTRLQQAPKNTTLSTKEWMSI